jgi:hypothetical protein
MTTISVVENSNMNRVLFAVFTGAETSQEVADRTDISLEVVEEYLLSLSKTPYNILTVD